MVEAKEQTMVLVTKGREYLVGRCVHTPGRGWKFLSNVTSHKDSRKFWNDCNACIPAWAMDRADEMMTWAEWDHHRNAAKAA